MRSPLALLFSLHVGQCIFAALAHEVIHRYLFVLGYFDQLIQETLWETEGFIDHFFSLAYLEHCIFSSINNGDFSQKVYFLRYDKTRHKKLELQRAKQIYVSKSPISEKNPEINWTLQDAFAIMGFVM